MSEVPLYGSHQSSSNPWQTTVRAILDKGTFFPPTGSLHVQSDNTIVTLRPCTRCTSIIRNGSHKKQGVFEVSIIKKQRAGVFRAFLNSLYALSGQLLHTLLP